MIKVLYIALLLLLLLLLLFIESFGGCLFSLSYVCLHCL